MDPSNHVNPKSGGLPDVALNEIEGEPRARDTDIAERLGFDRPRDIRKLIERNAKELATFGTCATVARVVRGNPVTEYWLNEEQALLISAVSEAPNAAVVRSMLIRVFVAWRRGHLTAPEFDGVVTDLSPAVRRAVGGIVKGIVHGEVAEAVTAICATVCERMLPSMVAAQFAQHNLMIRRGRTAGQVYREAGFPPLKGIAGWFGNRLKAMDCSIEGHGRAEMGFSTARLFDPDKAHRWLENGGRLAVERKLAERRGHPVQLQIVGLEQGRKANG